MTEGAVPENSRETLAPNLRGPKQGAAEVSFFESDHLLPDLSRRSARGGVLTLAAQAVKFLLQMGSTVVLARLLSPADFGLFAMVTAVTGFVFLFKDAGLSLATIQQNRITHEQVSMLFWVNVSISILLMIVTSAMAPLIAWFYDDQRLIWMTLVISGSFILGGFSVQHQALLRRQMAFRRLALIDIVAMLCGVVAAIVIGLATRSYWALVAMPVVIMLATAVGVWLACPWVPGPPRRAHGTGAMLRFGGTLTGFNVVNYFSRNVDNVLTGWWLGATALGFYSKAYSLLLLPINQINGPFSTVMLPALSRLQNDPQAFRKLYLEVIQGIAWLGMPTITLLALHAGSIVPLVLGDQWLPAVPVFQLLAPAALMATTNVAGSWSVIPVGRPDKELKLALVTSPCFVLAICIGLPFGIEGVAIAVSLSRVLLKLPSLGYCYSGTALKVADFLRAIAQPAAVCVLMALLHYALVYRWPLELSMPLLAAFLTEAAVAGVCFLVSPSSRRLLSMLGKKPSLPS